MPNPMSKINEDEKESWGCIGAVLAAIITGLATLVAALVVAGITPLTHPSATATSNPATQQPTSSAVSVSPTVITGAPTDQNRMPTVGVSQVSTSNSPVLASTASHTVSTDLLTFDAGVFTMQYPAVFAGVEPLNVTLIYTGFTVRQWGYSFGLTDTSSSLLKPGQEGMTVLFSESGITPTNVTTDKLLVSNLVDDFLSSPFSQTAVLVESQTFEGQVHYLVFKDLSAKGRFVVAYQMNDAITMTAEARVSKERWALLRNTVETSFRAFF